MPKQIIDCRFKRIDGITYVSLADLDAWFAEQQDRFARHGHDSVGWAALRKGLVELIGRIEGRLEEAKT